MAEPQHTELAGFPGAHAEAVGEQRPFSLVMIHGILVDHQDFGSYLRFFSDRGYDSYAFARRGRAGVAPPDAAGVRIRDYLEDTFGVLDALGGQPVVLGHSLGALLAQKVAESGRARAIVLVSPTPPRGVGVRPPASALPFYLNVTPAMVSGRPKLPPARLIAKVAQPLVPSGQRRSIYARMVPESGLVYRELAVGTPVNRARVTCPVLVVGGGADGVYPPRVARAIAKHYGAEVMEYPGNDHWIIDEPGFEGAAGDIATWLDRVAP